MMIGKESIQRIKMVVEKESTEGMMMMMLVMKESSAEGMKMIVKKESSTEGMMMVVEIESTEGRRKSGETKVMRGKAVEITPREADTKVLVRVRGVKVTHEL